MKRFRSIIIPIAAWLPVSAAAEGTSVVRFSNSDQLSGSLESLTTDRLVWKSPILEAPTPFFLRNVLDLSLSAVRPEISAKHEAVISLTNGDTVSGQLASVSDDAVELDTWFAGRMKFRRVMIQGIRIDERPTLLYQGPDGIDDWTQSDKPPSWSYRDSALVSKAAGSVARDVNLPDECSIAFDAAWRGTFGLKMIFFSDDLTSDSPPNGYDLNFQQRAIYLRNCQNEKSLGAGANAFALQENEKARIEVRASLKSGTICVFVDGKIIAVWTDPDVAENKVGRGIHFVSVNASPVKISRIAVTPWDGVVDKLPEPRQGAGFRQFGIQEMPEESAIAADKAEEGRMMLRNGDTIVGDVLAIEDGMITIKTPFKEVRLPVEVLESVALKTVSLERCKRENGDVRGWFSDGTSIVFRLDGVGDETLTGYNQNFGTAEFKLAAFSRIEFNIYDPKLEDLRNETGW